VGTYHWVVSATVDANNNKPADVTNETFMVGKANPSLVTLANPTGTFLVLNTFPTLSDTATLSGGYHETGTLTFTLTGPSGFSFSHVVNVNGNGNYTVSTGGETALGTYTWTVAYSGDSNNNIARDQGGSKEQVTLAPMPPSTATIGFWANKNGQTLLQTYGIQLGNWLATYNNLFGNLNGATGTQVGSYFTMVKNAASGPVWNTYAQVLATALDIWVTTTGLGWNTNSNGPTKYGFHQGYGSIGLGDYYYNVGSYGASFGVANNSPVKVSDLLAYFNSVCVRVGGSYTKLPTSLTFYGNNNRTLLNGANAVFNGINSLDDV
jgi:hypothetical protein